MTVIDIFGWGGRKILKIVMEKLVEGGRIHKIW